MSAAPKFRKGDLIDIVFRRAVVTEVYDSGRLAILHSDAELDNFWPDAIDVETTIVGYEEGPE